MICLVSEREIVTVETCARCFGVGSAIGTRTKVAQAKKGGVLMTADRERWYLIRLVFEREIAIVETCAKSFGEGPLLEIGPKWRSLRKAMF
jgi:hypothetical protein